MAASATIRLDAAVEKLADVRAFVRAFATDAGADEETESDLVQAVDELACNVIEHGYRGTAGSLEVAIDRVDDSIRVRLRDSAPAFDPRTVPEPRLDLPLEQRPLGGMGIHLARALTDRIDHRILPEGGNEVVVTKRIRPAGR
ncbi:MAG TPA: ATP-binding protein [Candidatus Limnocylindrales bacterium]|nr:ATP-binding protein [Candidatus Limnocylindrales bacterium]